ncbi:MAG: hypothetical protein RL026_546 [Pseudomonadota bacterium]|jgi:outer membrane protein assembly factor BamD
MPSFLRPASRALSARLLTGMMVIALLALLGACASDASRLQRMQPDFLYERASKALRAGDYGEAIRVLEAITARYPFTEQARQARLDVIYAYYQAREKESALDAADTFIRENPAHPRIDYAWYLKGLVDFERTPYRIERWMGIDLTERPPDTALKSFQSFRTLVEQYPRSQYVHDARKRMTYLRNRLAGYEMQVARYYLERGAYIAAARRAQGAIERYDGAPTTREALDILVECYQQLGYWELADNTRAVIAANYPESAAPAQGPRSSWWRVWERF